VHQFADWEKLEAFGWNKRDVPEIFKSLSDDIWWPRNTNAVIKKTASSAGCYVLQ